MSTSSDEYSEIVESSEETGSSPPDGSSSTGDSESSGSESGDASATAAAAAKFGQSSVVAKVSKQKKFRILTRRVDFADDDEDEVDADGEESDEDDSSRSGSGSGSSSESEGSSGSEDSSEDSSEDGKRGKRSKKKRKRSKKNKKKRKGGKKNKKKRKMDPASKKRAARNSKVAIQVLKSSSMDVDDDTTKTGKQIVANIADDFAVVDGSVEITTILDVQVPKDVSKRYQKYSRSLEKRRPYLARNNFVTRRLYHGTYAQCDIGLNGNDQPCVLPDCSLCNILRYGFDPEAKRARGAKLRAHPSLLHTPPPAPPPRAVPIPVGDAPPSDDDETDEEEAVESAGGADDESSELAVRRRLGHGTYFAVSPVEAEEYATLQPSKLGKYGRRVVLVAQVAVGNPFGTYTYMDEDEEVEDEETYDCAMGLVADVSHPDGQFATPEYCVRNPDAALVTQVVVYASRERPLCPRCGVGVYYPERADRMVSTKYAVFCSKRCGRQYSVALRAMRKLVATTPTKPDPWFAPYWELTDSDDTAVMVELWAGSLEWSLIETEFKKTVPNVEVVKMYRIQNEHLYNRYVRELEAVREKNGNDGNEKLLFHGTSSTDPTEIWDSEDGFDFRFSEWGMWGRAMYAACNASYSLSYAFTEPSGYQSMFVAKFISGDSAQMEPDSNLTRPPKKSEDYPVVPTDDWGSPLPQHAARRVASKIAKAKKRAAKKGSKKIKHARYDTVTGFTGGSRVYMAYSFKAYPAYLVTYKNPWSW